MSRSFLLLCLLGFLGFAQAVPPTLHYAGQVAVDGQPFDGQGLFKFALLNADGNETLWSNDGTSVNGSQPQTSVSVEVNGGLYSLLLGNSSIPGMGAIDPTLFAHHSGAALRVWFSDGVNGFQQLSPDRPFASVPYAFSAGSAPIGSGSITTAQLNEQILKYLKPEITTHPEAPGLIFSGQSMNLTSQAEGKYLSYQWNRNGQPIAGATGPSFSITEVNGTLHDGNYTLVVSNDFGSVTSTPTALQVDGTPSAHTVASIGMEMTFCPPGTFTMGSPTSETGRGGDETQHQVTLTNGFYLGKYEVTQAQYQTVMNGNSEGLSADPSQFKGSNRPVEKVTWEDVQVFLTRLNSIEQSVGRLPNGWKYVLPTEAEWEYACRAGTTTAYSWGDDINASRANYNWDGGANDGNDSKQTVNIGQFPANPWGFFDMHGNVWEWVHDWKANYLSGAQTDPEGPASGSDRVARGGSWRYGTAFLRSARRPNFFALSSRPYNIGFRVAFQAAKPDGANPELELFGGAGITRDAGQAWAEPGVEAHDARDGNITSSVTVTGAVDMNKTGTYVLTYSVADAAGNTDSATRTVTVVDTTAPVLTLLGDANMIHAKNTAWVDPGATASDSLDGNLTSSITITGTVDINVTGVYTLTYSVTDGASNETNATRTVYVRKAHSVDLNESVKLDMLWVEPGTFTMGSPTTEADRGMNETEHNVTLTQGFYLGKYEVTQAQYEAVMTGNGDGLSATPSQFVGANRPVERVSWENIQVFLTRLNAQQSANVPAGWAYVLPTESQWEYACRAGTTTAYSWGNDINATRANYNASGIGQTRDVGYYAANPWGFFDMHGNVWEWTADRYGTYSSGAQIDPTGPASGSPRVVRGGSRPDAGTALRSANRGSLYPSDRYNNGGFRVGYQFIGEHIVDLNASVNMEMLWVEPGTFTMGSPTTEAGRQADREDEHNVTLTQGFYLGKYEVTQVQYEAVMTGNTNNLSATPSEWPNNPNRPVEQVSWNDIQIFLTRLNAQESANMPTGWAYVLPTETQWEYACRAGTTTMYSWGNDINATWANYNVSGLSQTRDVGYYASNPWGFFDMHGNVWEWTADWYQAAYPTGNPVVDPSGPALGSNRIIRGGAFQGTGTYLRSAVRLNYAPSDRGNSTGFRVGFQALKPDTAKPELELFGGALITKEAGQAWAEPGVEAHDVRDGNITSSITVSGTVDMNNTGTYLLTYSVTDAAGNEANATRTVTVVDTTAPVLALLGDANITYAKNTAWVDPGATASDSLDGNLTSSIIITGAVDVNTTGVYTLTYFVSDGASNEANATRTVYVQGEKQVTSANDSEGSVLTQSQINQVIDSSSSTFYSISKNGTIAINVSVEFRNDPILKWDSWDWWYSVTENNGGRYIQVLTKRNGPDGLMNTSDDEFDWSTLWSAPGPGTGSGLKQLSESLSAGTYQGDGVVVTDTPIYGFRSGYGGQSSATQTFKLYHFAVKNQGQVIVWDLKL